MAGHAVTTGSLVWVEDENESWTEGEVLSVSGDEATVKTAITTVSVRLKDIQPRDPDTQPHGTDDMTTLSYLSEPGVLYNLKCRYGVDEIYTYTGNILIAVNPFQKLPHLYDASMMEQYKGVQLGELSPHVFAVADSAFRAMLDEKKSQSILVSGESGAGKTETTKLIMQYLAYMGGRADTDGRTVEQQVLESNPLLEAFGNAKTVRNNNSSRFGKFVEIQFDNAGRISGAAVRTYLLERSRVVQITDPERNYHAFYQLCAGASAEEKARYKLEDARSYHYLNQSSCIDLNGVDNAEEYGRTKHAMDVVGIKVEDQEAIFRVLAAILHLGNVEFVAGDDGDSSRPKDDASQFHLDAAAELLQCSSQGLEDSLCVRIIVTRDGDIRKTLDPVAAVNNRDALAKTIYSRLFDWLVQQINESIGQDPNSKVLVGVLDIYGFESFQQNSFEQFCINLANEKLQQHFNQHVFKMEQEEYEKEAINWSYIEFVDNQDVLDLIEKKPIGIIALLDEACLFPKSTHDTFATKLYSSLSSNGRFSKPKRSQTDFAIDHYAGEVVYQTELFLEKNKDYVIAEHQALLGSAGDAFVRQLFPAPADEGNSKSGYKFSSIGTRFKQQLALLMETLSHTEPHYIRCVKPNQKQKPFIFESVNVMHQLRCGGVLEAVRISCAGYPTRKTFEEFVDRFGLLAASIPNASDDEKVLTQQILEKEGLSNYQLGKSKVFLRAGQMAQLDNRRAEVLNAAAKTIQRKARSFLGRRWFVRVRQATLTIQRCYRGHLGRKAFEALRREDAAVRIQKTVRRHQAEQSYKRQRHAAIVLQAGARGMSARKQAKALRREKAATVIQTRWRGYKAKSGYKKLQRGVLVAQCLYRGRLARRELRKLKLAARETGALQAAKSKLEKQVEELTWRLQLAQKISEQKVAEVHRLQAELKDAKEHAEQAQATLAKERQEHKADISAAKSSSAEVAVAGVSAKASAELLAKYEKLVSQNGQLMQMMDEANNRANNAEARLSRFKEVETRAKKLEARLESEVRKAEELNDKLAALEQENKVLRQGALVSPGVASRSRISRVSGRQLSLENGDELGEDGAESPGGELARKREKLVIDHTQLLADQEELLKVVMTEVGFSHDRPVAACVIFKSLLHWHSFEAERTNVFDRIIQNMGLAIDGNQENNEILAYWLSNTATLLSLLQRTLKASASSGATKKKQLNVSLMGRLTQGFRTATGSGPALSTSPSFGNGASPAEHGGSPGTPRQVEAKYPALLFKQQLTANVEKIYCMIRDNLKKEVTPLLGSCIQAPRASRLSTGKTMVRSPSAAHPPSATPMTLSSHWHSIINSFSQLLNTMRANRVPPFLVRKLFTQIFSFVNVQLFNSLLLRRECCSFSNGEYVKAGLAELEHWIYEASEEYAGASWDELRYIRQAVGFLVIHQKPKKSLDEITHDLCPILSIQQLYRISTMYWDDKYGTHSVAPEVIAQLRVLMTEDSNSAGSNSFLLDDDSSIPFSIDDISKSVPALDVNEIEPPLPLQSNPSFAFLMPTADAS